jgi:hypothetical protein
MVERARRLRVAFMTITSSVVWKVTYFLTVSFAERFMVLDTENILGEMGRGRIVPK